MSATSGQHWMAALVTIDGAYHRCNCGAVNFKDAERCRLEYSGEQHQLGDIIVGLPAKGTYDGLGT